MWLICTYCSILTRHIMVCVGIHLDNDANIFHRQLDCGFVWNYPLEFLVKNFNGRYQRIKAIINVKPNSRD